MSNEEQRPKRNHMGPPGRGVAEKPKDYKSAIKRLFIELNSFRIMIFVALLLAGLGAVLSILAPNRLSKITDKISDGLVVNQKNIKKLTTNITKQFSEDNMKDKMSKILKVDISKETIMEIRTSDDISSEDKASFMALLQSDDPSTIMMKITSLPDSILNIIIKENEVDGVVIPVSDQIELLKLSTNMNNKKNISFPDSINKVLLDEITIDKVKISSSDQIKFITAMSTIDTKKVDVNKLYKKIDKMPKSIKKVIKPKMDLEKIKSITIGLIILYICSALFTYVEQLIMTIVSNKFAKKLRSNISKKINKLPLKYFDNNSIGDILSRVTNDVDMIAQTMNQSLATLVSSTTLFLGTIIMMFYTNWIMALTAILSSFIGFIFMFLVLGKSQKYFSARQTELGKLNGHIEEVYSGLNVVKVYNGKKESDKKFDEYNKNVYEANRKSQFLSGLMMPVMNFIGNFGYVAVCVVGALLTMNDYISFGVIVAFITYVRLFTSPLSQIAQAMNSLQSTAAASERVFKILDEEEMKKEKVKNKIVKEKAKGEIEFKNVVFKYDGNEEPTIRDFTAKVKPGQKVAIVGPTGAGKTTMVNLLMRFYDIDSGDIKIDGVSIKDLSRENIHDLFTMVLQDTWLFNGTVKENVIYNRKNVTDKDVKEACKVVGLDHFIRTLPDGYDSDVANNDSISSGQKQLLTIARGMTENAPFLILDEATSNVDTRTEELVQKAMDKLSEGKTSFIIAHRLSTIKNADLILVMKDGNIIETGNHKQLMKKKGFYADLYNSQFEL